MAEDLGTWPPDQATVLVDVLQRAGIDPTARRTRDGIEVTVSDEQGDEAHATLVAHMDTIARAARPQRPDQDRRRRPRAVPQGGDPDTTSPPERPLTAQRLARFGRPLAVLVAGLMISSVMPGPLRFLVLIAAVAAMVWLIGRESDQGEEA